MPQYGGFTSTRELIRTPFGAVYAAHREGETVAEGAEVLAVRVCRPEPVIVGEREAAAIVAAFVDSARAQQEAAGPGMVAVHEIGTLPATEAAAAGAYVVTDLAVRGSCERLITGASSVDARSLSNIIRQVAESLAGLKARRGRGHGRIEPRHVLLMDEQPLASVRVALTDPLPDEQGSDEAVLGADLRAVGGLIYRLVVRRGYSGSWPVVDSPEWQRLGRGAAGPWRELCNRLLAPEGEAGASEPIAIERLSSMVPAPGVGASPRRRKRVAIAAAIVVLVGAGVAWKVLSPGQPPPTFAMIGANAAVGEEARSRWEQLVAAYYPRQGWLDPFVQAIQPDRKVRESEAESIAAIKQWCPDLLEQARPLAAADNKPAAIAGRADEAAVFWEDPAPGSLRELSDLLREPKARALEKYRYLGDAAIERTREVSGQLEKLRSFMLEEWAPTKSLNEAQGRFRDRGWNTAAEHVEGLSASLRATLGDGQVLSGDEPRQAAAEVIVRVAQAAAAVESVEREYGEAVAAARGVSAEGDPVLAKLGEALPALVVETSGADGGGDPLTALARSVQAAKKLVGEVVGLADPARKPPVDRRELARVVGERGLGNAAVTQAIVRSWIEAAGSAVVAGEHPAVKLTTAADETQKLVAAYGLTPSSRAEIGLGFSGELTRLQGTIGEIAGRSYVAGTKAELDRLSVAAETEIAGLSARVRSATAEALERERAGLEAMRAEMRSDVAWIEIASSRAINEQWRQRRDAMMERPGQTVAGLVAERRRVRELLQRLDETVAAAPAVVKAEGRWGELLAEAAAEARDRAIGAAIGGLKAGELDEAGVTSAAVTANAACTAWLKQAESLKADMSRVQRVLVTAFSLNAKADDNRTADAIWNRWQADSFVKEAPIARALEPLAVRVQAHRGIASEQDAERLLAVIRETPVEGVDVAVAAFERLIGESASGGLAWPRRAEQLAAAAQAAGRVKSLVTDSGLESADKARASERVAQETAAGWTAFARRQLDGGEGLGTPTDRAAAFRAAVAAMADFGVKPAEVTDARVRSSLLLAAFAGSLGEASDDSVRQLAASLRSGLEGVSGVEDPRLAAVLTDLRNRIETPPKITPVEQLGPGAKGFAPKGRFESGRITFSITEGQDITFIAIDRPEGTVFIAEHEASLELFRALAEKGGMTFVELVNAGWLGDRPERAEKPDEEWTGPRAWRWARASGGFRLSAGTSWYDSRSNPLQKFQTTPAYPDVVRDPQKRPDPAVIKLPAGMGEEPTGAMPMQRMTARGAVEACAVMGCRLPTESEWRAALAAMPRREAGPGFNLRDQTFKRLDDYIRPLRDGGTVSLDFHRLPDEGSYNYRDDRLGGAHPFADGFVWFWPVTAGPTDQPLRNLVGNVAEVVMTDAGNGFAAIGGSALSRIEDPIDRAVPIDESASFWDVGFRPAFSSKDRVPEPLRVQARQILTERLGETMLLMNP